MIRHSGKAIALLPLLFCQVLSWLGSVLQYGETMLGSSVKLLLSLVSLSLQWSARCVQSSRSASHIVSKILSLPHAVSELHGEGGCGSRCESCALFQQPGLQPWLSSQCWVQKCSASPKRLSHVSPDHERSANESLQLSETAHNSYNFLS